MKPEYNETYIVNANIVLQYKSSGGTIPICMYIIFVLVTSLTNSIIAIILLANANCQSSNVLYLICLCMKIHKAVNKHTYMIVGIVCQGNMGTIYL